MDVLDRDLLLTLATMAVDRLDQSRVGPYRASTTDRVSEARRLVWPLDCGETREGNPLGDTTTEP